MWSGILRRSSRLPGSEYCRGRTAPQCSVGARARRRLGARSSGSGDVQPWRCLADAPARTRGETSCPCRYRRHHTQAHGSPIDRRRRNGAGECGRVLSPRHHNRRTDRGAVRPATVQAQGPNARRESVYQRCKKRGNSIASHTLRQPMKSDVAHARRRPENRDDLKFLACSLRLSSTWNTGLKIPFAERRVWVRNPPPASTYSVSLVIEIRLAG